MLSDCGYYQRSDETAHAKIVLAYGVKKDLAVFMPLALDGNINQVTRSSWGMGDVVSKYWLF